jgi:hypothetical protein
VLMGHGPLAAGHLERGALIAPFPQRVGLSAGFRPWSARPLRTRGTVGRVMAFLTGASGEGG